MADGGVLRRLTAPVYLIAVLLVILPILDFVTNVWPLQPGQAVWRYGTVGLFSGFVLTPLLGVLVAIAAAALAEHGRALGVMGILSLAIGVVFLLLMGLFLLDAFEVRANVPPAGKPQFDSGIWRAVVKYLAVAVAVIWMGVAARRSARHLRRAR